MATKESMDEDADYYYEDEDDERGYRDCPKCSRTYDEIDYEYQSCHKCGWDAGNNKWEKPTRPTESDYLNGDADILTGRWI